MSLQTWVVCSQESSGVLPRPLALARLARDGQDMPRVAGSHHPDAPKLAGYGQVLTELVFSGQRTAQMAHGIDGRGDGTGWTPSVTRASQTPC